MKIERMIERGYDQKVDAAPRMAVRLLEERNRRLQWPRDSIAETDAQIERGEYYIMTPEGMGRIEDEAEQRFLRGEMPSRVVCP